MIQKIATKVFTQLFLGLALSVIYMQIRPLESYTLDWPFSFLAAWFLCFAWFAYLRYDKLSIFDVTDRYKKQVESEVDKHDAGYFNIPGSSFIRHVYTPILKSDPTSTKAEVLKIRMLSNGICSLIFIILVFIF